jgi:hypothetical protein
MTHERYCRARAFFELMMPCRLIRLEQLLMWIGGHVLCFYIKLVIDVLPRILKEVDSTPCRIWMGKERISGTIYAAGI